MHLLLGCGQSSLFDLGRFMYLKEDFSGNLQAPAAREASPVEQLLCGKPSIPGRTGHKPVRKPGAVSQVVFKKTKLCNII